MKNPILLYDLLELEHYVQELNESIQSIKDSLLLIDSINSILGFKIKHYKETQ